MSHSIKFVGPAVALFLSAASLFADHGLADRLSAVMNRPDYKHGRWAALVIDSANGEVVFERNADQMIVPASVTKIYTCGTALEVFGPDFRFETNVYRRGDLLVEGTLKGDLILIASGDLTMGGRTDDAGRMVFMDSDHTYADSTSLTAKVTPTDPLAGLADLAKQVRQGGIKRIDGDVLIDDRLFDTAQGSGSGPSRISPIVVNDNVVDVLIDPATEAGKPATVRLRPDTSFVRMDPQVTTVAKGEKSVVEVWRAGPRSFAVRGKIALGAPPLVRIYEIDEPALFARALFIDCLRKEKIQVVASPLFDPKAVLPDRAGLSGLTKVAEFKSPPFSEVIKVTLKVSHNLYASTMPLLVAARDGKRALPEGMRIQGLFLQKLGLDPAESSFAGGAGGMNADSTTARQTVRLLQKLKEQAYWPAIHAGLPDLGIDGTLATVVPSDSPAKGKAHAKTGTLSWFDPMNERVFLRSKALAGVMTTSSGRSLTFAMFVNDVPLPKGETSVREGKVLGHLCELLYDHTAKTGSP